MRREGERRGVASRGERRARAKTCEMPSWFHGRWQVGERRAAETRPVSACFPARGLPQSGSKGLSQSNADHSRPTPLANAPRAAKHGARADYRQQPRQSKTGVSTPSTLCSFGLVVVYCSWMRLSGKTSCAAAKAASAASWKPRQDQLLLARVGVDVADREDARRRWSRTSRCRRRSACARAPGPSRRSARASGSGRRRPAARRAAATRVTPSLPGTLHARRAGRRFSKPVGWPTMNSHLGPASRSAFMLRDASPASASKPSRRCTRMTLAGLVRPVLHEVQRPVERAESPPPTMTRFLPANCAGFAHAVEQLRAVEARRARRPSAAAAGTSRRRRR